MTAFQAGIMLVGAVFVLLVLLPITTKVVRLLWQKRTSATKKIVGSSEKKDVKEKKKSHWFAKWPLIGGGILALVVLILWSDTIWMTVENNGFSFAEDTGLGRLLSEKYGTTAANWLLIVALLVTLATIVGISIGWKTIVTMIKAGLFIIVIYLAVDFGYNFWLEVSEGTPKYREQSQAGYPVIQKPSPPVDEWQKLVVTERTRVKVGRLPDCHKLVVKPGGAVDGSLERNRSTIEFWAVQPLQYRMVYSSKPSGC